MFEQLSKLINAAAAVSDRKYATLLPQLHEAGKKLMEVGEMLTNIQV